MRFAVSGQYAVPDAEAAKLAGLSLQIEYGDYCAGTHTELFLRKELPKHIAQRLHVICPPFFPSPISLLDVPSISMGHPSGFY